MCEWKVWKGVVFDKVKMGKSDLKEPPENRLKIGFGQKGINFYE